MPAFVSPLEAQRRMSIPSEANRRFISIGSRGGGPRGPMSIPQPQTRINRFTQALRGIGRNIFGPSAIERSFSTNNRTLRSNVFPISGAPANVAQTLGKGLSYTPFGTIFQEGKASVNALRALKQYGAGVVTTLGFSEIAKNSFNYAAGRPFDFTPSKGELITAGLAGFFPASHIVGSVAGLGFAGGREIINLSKSGYGKAKDAIGPMSIPQVPPIIDYGPAPRPPKEIIQDFGQDIGAGFAGGISSFPTLPVQVSIPSIGGGMGGFGPEVLALLGALGGGYLLGKRRKKRKKYKRKKPRKR